jgi:hypothetical protein
MATFEEAGIRYLTAASIQAFRDNSALWVMRYLFGRSDFRSAAFARSLALNDGMKAALHYGDVGRGEDAALWSYERRLEGAGIKPSDPSARSEQDAILPMFNMAVKALQENLGGLERPISSGLATHTFIGDFSTPFLSVPTFVFEQVQLHIKYTHRLPSKIQPKDMMALAIDGEARDVQPGILYVTMKKHAWLIPSQRELTEAAQQLVEDASALTAFLGAADSPEQALAMCPLNPEFYQWKPQLLSDCRTILRNHKEKLLDGSLCPQIGRRFSESPARHPHRNLLPDYRSGDADNDGEVW